jgi:hypothetical protein
VTSTLANGDVYVRFSSSATSLWKEFRLSPDIFTKEDHVVSPGDLVRITWNLTLVKKLQSEPSSNGLNWENSMMRVS